MTTTTTAISTGDKREIVGRFVSDVLAQRANKLIKAKHAILQARAKRMFNKATVDIINKLYAQHDDDKISAFDVAGIEVNGWIADHCEPTKELEYEPELYLATCVSADTIKGIPETLTIKLPYAVRFDSDDGVCVLEPRSGRFGDSSDPDTKAWDEIEKAQKKLEQDAKHLSDVAYKSIARKKTYEAIEKNCPELAPYITAPDENTPCPAELADLASCMRVKDDC